MEKRKERRYKKRIFIMLNGKQATLWDLSMNGFRVITPQPPKLKKVKISFKFNQRVFELAGSIRWAQREYGSQSQIKLGVFLENPPPDYYENLFIAFHFFHGNQFITLF